jgi:putative membrane protein
MLLAANIVIGLIALLHVYILVLEMFMWETPRVMKVFKQTKETAVITKVLAANQGLYNGFLAAGLFWGLYLGQAGNPIKVFFLLCGGFVWRCDSEQADFVYSSDSSRHWTGFALVLNTERFVIGRIENT